MVERVDVWAAPIADEPGGMARVLDELRVAGADLDFIIARRDHKSGGAVLFVTPLRGDKEIDAAAELGFNITASVNALRVEGQNQQGLAALIAGKLAGGRASTCTASQPPSRAPGSSPTSVLTAAKTPTGPKKSSCRPDPFAGYVKPGKAVKPVVAKIAVAFAPRLAV
jgi:hypothetical protein